MIDVEKQVAYWRESAAEEWVVTHDLLEKGHLRHCLFFAHLTLEKILKALVCRKTRDLAPRMHDLLRLATLAGLSLEESNRDLLKMFGVYQMEGRYPDVFPQAPDLDLTRKRLGEAERIYRWLMNLLSA
jgi:HEPN domain-containing protein